MKTTIEIDEPKLIRVMKLGDFKTRKEAIDFALSEAERQAYFKQIKANPWSKDFLKDAIVEGYEPIQIRELEIKKAL